MPASAPTADDRRSSTARAGSDDCGTYPSPAERGSDRVAAEIDSRSAATIPRSPSVHGVASGSSRNRILANPSRMTKIGTRSPLAARSRNRPIVVSGWTRRSVPNTVAPSASRVWPPAAAGETITAASTLGGCGCRLRSVCGSSGTRVKPASPVEVVHTPIWRDNRQSWLMVMRVRVGLAPTRQQRLDLTHAALTDHDQSVSGEVVADRVPGKLRVAGCGQQSHEPPSRPDGSKRCDYRTGSDVRSATDIYRSG